jgi:hypothetical protein
LVFSPSLALEEAVASAVALWERWKKEGISTTENTENTEEEWLEVEGDGHDADGSWF